MGLRVYCPTNYLQKGRESLNVINEDITLSCAFFH